MSAGPWPPLPAPTCPRPASAGTTCDPSLTTIARVAVN